MEFFNGQAFEKRYDFKELNDLDEEVHKLKQELRMAALDIKSLAQVVSNMREEEITYEEYDDGLPGTNEITTKTTNSDFHKERRRIAKDNRERYDFRKRGSSGSRTASRSRSNLYLD